MVGDEHLEIAVKALDDFEYQAEVALYSLAIRVDFLLLHAIAGHSVRRKMGLEGLVQQQTGRYWAGAVGEPSAVFHSVWNLSDDWRE